MSSNQQINKKANQEMIHQAYADLNNEYKKINSGLFPSFEKADDNSSLIRKSLKDISNKYDDEVIKTITQETLGYGPIEELLADLNISEIIINKHDEVFYEKNNKIEKHNKAFSSKNSYQQFIRKMTSEANIKYDLNTPFCNGQWTGNRSSFRVHLIALPLNPFGAQLTLRRIKTNGWSLTEFEEAEFLTAQQSEKLQKLYNEKQSLLIIGPTGTGKTSLANALLKLSKPNERIICLEDTDELKLPNTLSTKLLTRVDLNKKLKDFELSDLLIQSLRMRPDRLVLGEVRGAEAKDLLMTFSTGHKGGMATLHADNPMQALWRLEMLVQMGAPAWSTDGIRRLIKLGIDYIVTIGFEDNKRKLIGLHKIQSLEPTGFLFKNETS